MAFDIKKFLSRFVDEARDHVSKLNEGLVALEKHPDDAELINSIFRSAHTIKGSSRMLKLTPITEVAHKMEDVLGALRDKKIGHSKALADLLFKGLDVISEMVEKVAAEQEIAIDTGALCAALMKAAEGQAQPLAETPVSKEAKPQDAVDAPEQAEEPKQAPAAEHKVKASETIRVKAEKLDELIKLIGELVSSHNRARQRTVDIRETESEAKALAEISTADENKASAIKLFTGLNRLSTTLKEDSVMQDLLITELQEKALMLRMVPLSMVFDPLRRMVRDFSTNLGKDVNFIVEGGETELDRKMIEKLGDPLVHMIRNCIDHGIEPAEERRLAGKPDTGTIRLSAGYEAGSVLIELADDGGGISLGKIREKALRRKLFDENTLGTMKESELVDLIFQPGFSTSSIITDVSGRGVGMDVVKRNIVEELKGTVTVETKAGAGTSFQLRLPLTLAIMRILHVDISSVPFGINSHYVGEILRIPESELISVVDRKAVRLREEFIPVVSLGSLLGVPGNGVREQSESLIIILQMGGEKLGAVIDELLSEENVVIKPLPPHLRNLLMVSGVTISGRNEIINILHVPSLFALAKEMKETRKPKASAREERSAQKILVVDDSANTREIEKSILEAYGYSVDIAEDGVDALEKTRGTRYDMVITDIEMPRLDGFSLTERLRGGESYRETPIIIVTSREKEEDKKRGIMVGANAYIVKGTFDQTNLIETVQNLIG